MTQMYAWKFRNSVFHSLNSVSEAILITLAIPTRKIDI